MKRLIIVFIFCFIIFTATGCGNFKKSLNIPTENIEGLTVTTYDFSAKTRTLNWVYRDKDMADFLSFADSLKGRAVEIIDVDETISPLYGVEINSKDVGYEHKYLLVGDYLITHEGIIYEIDGNELEVWCKTIEGNTRVFEGLEYIENHRYISLYNNNWDWRFMYETNLREVEDETIVVSGESVVYSPLQEVIEFEITNESEYTLEYGSRLIFEVNIQDKWYQINDMINVNVNLAWNSLLHVLEPGKTEKLEFYTRFYDPLPEGRYRISKQVFSENEELGYVFYEFFIK